MNPHTKRLPVVALVVTVFVLGVVLGVVGGRLPEAMAGESGLTFVARMAQALPGVFTESEADGPADANLQPLSTFWEVREQIKRNYVERIDQARDQDLTYGAVRGMLAALKDPYTRFMDPEAYREFESENTGHFDGIGAVLEMRAEEGEGNLSDKLRATIEGAVDTDLPGGVTAQQREALVAAVADAVFGRFLVMEKATLVVINSVIPGGPADKSGLRPGDVITKVDDTSIHGMDITEVVRLIRGRRGTQVRLTVIREGQKEPVERAITRDTIDVPVVESEMLESKIGHIWLHTFNEQAASKVREAIEDLTGQGMRGLILDLTDDPGGLLDAAVSVGGLFISGPVVYIQERGGERQPLESPGEPALGPDLPLVVLINRGSASASEIVAGAVQDAGRGVVVGRPSFGKAKVQTVIKLHDDSAIALTTAMYLTPDGRNIDGEGITPDEEIPEPPNSATMKADEMHNYLLASATKIMKRRMAAADAGGGERG